MVFHPLHAAMHALIEPVLKPASLLVHALGLGDAREGESQAGSFFFDEPAVFLFLGIGSGYMCHAADLYTSPAKDRAFGAACRQKCATMGLWLVGGLVNRVL